VARVAVYGTGTCPLCQKAKALLRKWNVLLEQPAERRRRLQPALRA
jgi:glutaredoxin